MKKLFCLLVALFLLIANFALADTAEELIAQYREEIVAGAGWEELDDLGLCPLIENYEDSSVIGYLTIDLNGDGLKDLLVCAPYGEGGLELLDVYISDANGNMVHYYIGSERNFYLLGGTQGDWTIINHYSDSAFESGDVLEKINAEGEIIILESCQYTFESEDDAGTCEHTLLQADGTYLFESITAKEGLSYADQWTFCTGLELEKF